MLNVDIVEAVFSFSKRAIFTVPYHSPERPVLKNCLYEESLGLGVCHQYSVVVSLSHRFITVSIVRLNTVTYLESVTIPLVNEKRVTSP